MIHKFIQYLHISYLTKQRGVFVELKKEKGKFIKLHPAQILVIGFAVLIFLGTLLLMLPISTYEEGKGLHFVDALFEATSAVCVTGLAVVDTGTTFTIFGQLVMLFLVQIGGWGFMTIGIFMFIILGKKIGLKERLLLQDSLNLFTLSGVVKLVSRIIFITLIVEITGALILAIRWSFEMAWTKALYYGFFHSISAFNNAGFGLEPDNLSKWVGDPTVNLAITSLFIIGGIGFTVILDVWQKKSLRKLSLHSKVALLMTLILNVVGTIIILISEFHNAATIGNLSWNDKFWASYFQGVVPRTAGFNTIDIGHMTLSSQVFTMALMFIGASSGSTGGGIKVTTFAIIIFAFWTVLTNRSDVNIFKRRISWNLVNKSLSIGVSAIIFIFTIFFLLTYTEDMPMNKLLFETISAFGTVGLSTGITGDLSPYGKLLITLMMFIGRLGPLTMAFALMSKRHKARLRYAEEKILIG
ncbi:MULTISPECIES: TrkH family potassium uptake protein [Neobacillus]|uniref:TrkH family potassium uptake protein n=1 Tax=Neobacillus rhizophilus TaxID=2833579 RepID=A0A942YRW3_9BACI|nr:MULTISPECIES: TrkH family potassium uptake protein [Neobacillus]MBS4211258.1 TrkH family potassium uptake protein [Neobacillus rhizophilus]MBU8918781.1 TrkH family potassium uptake protein [Bacillus sp. FJAT-29953]